MAETSNRLLMLDRVDGRWADQPRANLWSQQLAWFRFYFDDGRWTWSPHVERMHGYYPGTVAPGTALMLSHVHPDDRQRVAAAFDHARHTHQTLSSHHRIIDTRHRGYEVVMIGAPFYDPQGAPAGMQGFFIDVTTVSPGRRAKRLRVTAANGHADGERRRIRAGTRC